MRRHARLAAALILALWSAATPSFTIAADSALRQLQPLVVPPGMASGAGTVFMERFAGSELSPSWEVINPQPDRYLVENGHLLVVARAVGALDNPQSENLLRLKQPVPDADWTITVSFDVELQTGLESLQFGLCDDPKSCLLADAYVSTACCGNGGLWLRTAKVAGGQTTYFDAQAVQSGWPGLAKAVMQPISMRLTKAGHEFRAGVSFAGKLDSSGTPAWTETASVTSLRPPKTFVLLARQTNETSGESPFRIHAITIEAPTK